MAKFIQMKARLFKDRDISTDPETPTPDWPSRPVSFSFRRLLTHGWFLPRPARRPEPPWLR